MNRRNFIKNTAIGGAAFSGLSLRLDTLFPENKLHEKATIKDRLWLWGQNPGSHHGATNPYNLPGKNLMDAREGCDFSAFRNVSGLR